MLHLLIEHVHDSGMKLGFDSAKMQDTFDKFPDIALELNSTHFKVQKVFTIIR